MKAGFSPWLVAIVLMACALSVRAWDLGRDTITHPEAYAPGIDFPEFATHPIERKSVSAIIRSSLLTDNHPPGYYLLLLPWSEWFGAGLSSLRLPSAVIGALTIPFFLLAARRWEGSSVAMLAATWLTFHGTHVLWSRSARMWVLCAAMAVVSVWALSDLRRRYRPGVAAAYVGSLILGLWADYTFWPVLAAQIVWELAGRTRSRTISPALGLQGLAIVLSSPIFVFLLSRLGSSAYLEAPFSGHLRDLLAFNSWFDMPLLGQLGPWGTTLTVALVALGAVAVGVGAWQGPSGPVETPDDTPPPAGLERLVWLAVLWPIGLIWLWRFQPIEDAYPVKTVTIAIAIAVAGTYSIAARQWFSVRRLAAAVFEYRPLRGCLSDLSLVLAIVPFGILAVASLVMPALAPRSTLALTPFVLVLASRGTLWLVRAPFLRAIVLVLVIGCGSLSVYLLLTAPPVTDYRGLATAIAAARERDDLLVIEDAWWSQPLHYYLQPGMMPSVSESALANPDALMTAGVKRFWVAGFADDPKAAVGKLTAGLRGYREVAFVGRLRAGAALFVREP